MSTPAELVEAIYADVGRGDLAAVAARVSSVFIAEQNAAFPFGGVWHGPDGFAAMGAAIFAAFPGFAVAPVRLIECGSAVLVETRVTAPATSGRPALDQPMYEYWRVEDDLAVECRPFYADPKAAAASAAP